MQGLNKKGYKYKDNNKNNKEISDKCLRNNKRILDNRKGLFNINLLSSRSFKMFISLFLILSIIFEYIPHDFIFAQSTGCGYLEWLNNRTLTNTLSEVSTTEDNTILLRWQVNKDGLYTLSFFAPDASAYNAYNTVRLREFNEKRDAGFNPTETGVINGTNVIRHEISVSKGVSMEATSAGLENLEYNHRIYLYNEANGKYDIDGTKEYCGFLNEWDFNGQPVPSYAVTGNTRIKYQLIADDNWKGKVYKLMNQEFKFSWTNGYDSENNPTEYFKIAFVNLSGITDGTIYEFNLETNADSDSEKIEVLKNLKMKAEASRWAIKNGNYDVTNNKTEIESIKADDVSKVRPAIKLSVTSPMVYKEDEKKFTYLTEAEASNLNLTINVSSDLGIDYNLAQITGKKLGELNFDVSKNMYSLYIIGVDDAPNDSYYDNIKLDPASNSKYIFRKKLLDSSVYTAEVIIIRNNTNISSKVRAYTYLAYQIVRKNIDETYVSITPYKYPGTYEVFAVYTKEGVNEEVLFSSETNKWAEHYITSEGKIPEKVYVPINILRTNTGDNWYTIGIRFREEGASSETKPINSELTFYDANADTNITIDVPKMQYVKDVTVINDNDGNTRVAKYNLTWGMPVGLFDGNGNYRILKPNEKMWYEVYMNTSSNKTDDADYQIADVIYLKRESNNSITITTKNNNDYHTGWYATVNQDSRELSAEILVKPVDKPWLSYLEPAWDYEIEKGITAPYTNSESAGNEARIEEYNRNDRQLNPDNYLNDFFNPRTDDTRVPGNYFITMRAFYDPVSNDNNLTVSDFGVPINVVLSESNEIIGIPRDVKFSDISKTNIKAKIDKVDPSEYIKQMLAPVKSKLHGNLQYEVFFAQKEELLLDILNLDFVKNKTEQTSTPGYFNKYLDDHATLIKFTGDANDNSYHEIKVGESSSDLININNLRNGDVYSFRTETTNLNFVGLDANTTYYMVVRTVLNIKNEYNGVVQDDIETRYSEISKIYYTITNTEYVVPEDTEKTPPTPINFDLEEAPEDKKISVKWEAPELVYEDGVSYGYEFVRVGEEKLSNEDRDSLLSIHKLQLKGYEEFVGYRITDDMLYMFDGNNFTPASNLTATTYDNLLLAGYMRIKDVDVNPNKIYFYYVRTIKLLDNGLIINSEWSELTATTVPVRGITKLREVSKPETYDIKIFDPHYERVISFEAPIGDAVCGTGQNCKLPTILDFNIQIKLATETEYYDAPAVELKAIAAASPETATYVYKISKLKSGNKYNIRVAVIDKTTDDGTGRCAMSKYSDPVGVRTEFSQEDYDKEEKYKSYKEYYENVLGKITNDIAFVLEDTKDTYTIKYKEEKFQGDLGNTRETTYLLPTNNDATKYTYYISKDNIKELIRLKKGLKIVKDGITVIIPYKFINEEYTKAYKDMLDKCDDLKNDIEDFYLKIWAGFTTPSTYVNNRKTISDQVQVSMKFIEQNALNMDIDYSIENEMLEAVYKNEEGFLDKIEDELKGKIDDKAVIEMVEYEKEELKRKLQTLINNRLNEYEKDSISLKTLFTPINVLIDTNDLSSKVAFKTPSGKWEILDTTHSMGNALSYANDLGAFVLTTNADANIIYGNENDASTYYTKSKYNLDNVLIRNGSLAPKTDPISKKLFLDIAFAITSVDSTDVFELAKQKRELDNKFVFYHDPLTRQEVVYGVIKLYDQFSGIDINKVIISNTSSASGIVIDEYYKQTILAGIQLGLITPNDIKNPNSKITVNELLELIYRIIG